MFIKLNIVNLIFIFRATNFFKRNGVIDNVLMSVTPIFSMLYFFFIFVRYPRTERISVRFSFPL